MLRPSGTTPLSARTPDPPQFQSATLTIGAAHDTMDPKHMAAMARALPRGRYLHCPDGSHMAMYDNQAVYMSGLLAFLREVGGDVAG